MAVTPGADAVATDFAGFTALREKARNDDPAALRAAARQFEALFTQLLLKSMRDASFGDDLMSSQQGDFYRDLFDQQVALSMSQGKGLGIADVLVRQLTKGGQNNISGPEKGGQIPITGSRTAGAAGNMNPTPISPGAAGKVNLTPIKPAANVNLTPISEEMHLTPISGEERFVREVLPHAQRAGAELGVAPRLLVAQSALETGWGRSVAAGANNLFGIKAGAGWKGERVSLDTQEFDGATARREQAAFRAYASVAESFDDYARLVGNASRYAAVRGAGDDAARFANGLQQAGYATDPAYADKIRRIAEDPAFLARIERATDLEA